MKNTINNMFKDLKDPWKIFVNILFHPVILITLIFSVFGTYLSTLYYKDETKTVAILFSILASLSAGILGSIVFDRYKEVTGNSILVKKGKSAVRNLSLIADQLHRLRIRLSEFNMKKMRISAGEIDHHLVTTEKSIVSGMEDWVDMVPELTTLTKISETVVERGNKMLGLMREKKELEKVLEKQDKAQKEKVTSLESRISQKNQEISNLSSEISKLRGQQISIGGPTLSSGIIAGSSLIGISSDLSSNVLSINTSRICNRCSKRYEVSQLMVDTGLCSNCSMVNY